MMTDQQKLEIVSLRKEGLSYSQIAERVGVVLNMSETVFWKSTLRKLHAVFKCHCEHMPKPTKKG